MESMRDRFVRDSAELMEADARLALVLADIGTDRFEQVGLEAGRHPRVFNAGIREQAMVGFAAGLALSGFRPVLHTYAPFIVERPFEQLKLDFGHQGLGGVFVSVGASYDWASGGRTHQCPGDVALLATLPGWRVQVPGHPDEVGAIFGDAARGEDCVYIRLAEAANRSARPAGIGGIDPVVRARAGAPTVIAVGPVLDAVLEAAEGLEATVLYTASPYPLDTEALRAHATGDEIVLVEPYLEGTSAARVTSAFTDVPHRLMCVGVPNVEHRRYGTRIEHDAAHGLDGKGIRGRLDAFLGRRRAA